MSYNTYDPKSPWAPGDELIAATFDHEDADTRDLDGDTVVVDTVVDDDLVIIKCIYGLFEIDPYSLVKQVK